MSSKSSNLKNSSNDLYKRIAWTIGFVILYRAALFVPAPGINQEALAEFLNAPGTIIVGSTSNLEMFSILALGLMPYLYAYFIVEVFALFVPVLKKWRNQDGEQGRARLKKAALCLTFLIALWQGYSIIRGFEFMAEQAGGALIVENISMTSRLSIMVILMAGTFLMVGIAEVITKKGIGHGISILVLCSGLSSFFLFKLPVKRMSELNLTNSAGMVVESFQGSTNRLVLFVIVSVLIVVFAVIAEKACKKIPITFNDNTQAYLPVKLTSAGTVPYMYASIILIFQATLAAFFPFLEGLDFMLAPGGWLYQVVFVFVLIIIYFFFTSFFYNPSKISVFLDKRKACLTGLTGKDGEKQIGTVIDWMALFGSLYLCVLIMFPRIVRGGWFVGSIALITTVVILLDLIGEFSFRRKSNRLVKVAEFGRIPIAGLAKSVLESKGVPCHLRGYYHRAVLYFFGPHIEVSMLVPEDRAGEAREVLEKYVGSDYR